MIAADAQQSVSGTRADYNCPQCDGQLRSGSVANQYHCQQCGETVNEAVSETYQRVRSFYRAVCSEEVSF